MIVNFPNKTTAIQFFRKEHSNVTIYTRQSLFEIPIDSRTRKKKPELGFVIAHNNSHGAQTHEHIKSGKIRWVTQGEPKRRGLGNAVLVVPQLLLGRERVSAPLPKCVPHSIYLSIYSRP